jgi:hypothetical protein
MTPIDWNDSEPTFPDFLPPAKDLNVPELTGRRRYLQLNGYPRYLVLQVEEAVFTEVSGKRGWEIRWRMAGPEDVTETVIG